MGISLPLHQIPIIIITMIMTTIAITERMMIRVTSYQERKVNRLLIAIRTSSRSIRRWQQVL